MVNTSPASLSCKQGFTLIELSLVLVIIGLIVGGVLVGRDLIYAASIRKVTTELQQLTLAINTFRGKYDCLPADCANASTFLGGGYNGNGDGYVEGWWVPANSYASVEAVNVMHHLSLAKMVQGKYVGNAGLANLGGGSQNISTTGLVQVSSFNPSIGYYAFSGINFSNTGANGFMIEIGAVDRDFLGNDFLHGAGFTAPEAKALDSKMDDGQPLSGKLLAVNPLPSAINPNTTCFSGTAYLTSVTTGCVMVNITSIP